MGKDKKGCPDGFPAAAWEKLNSIEANTETMLDRLANYALKCDALKLSQIDFVMKSDT